jgi:hypothetical protein
MDKHSSLLRKFVNYGEKKFYNIRPRLEKLARENALAYYENLLVAAVKSFIASTPVANTKNLFVCNLQIFVLS